METKFTINQKVYFIADGAILQGVIRGIKSTFVSNHSKTLITSYYIKYNDSFDHIWVYEYSIFKDKTDLINDINKL